MTRDVTYLYFFSIEGFCKNAELDFDDEDRSECYTEMEEFIPKALQIVYSDLEENGQKTCYDTFDICDLPKDEAVSSVLTRGKQTADVIISEIANSTLQK